MAEESSGPMFYPAMFPVEKALKKVPKSRQNDRLLVFDPKEKVMIEPNEAMSGKEFSSKNIKNKVSLKNAENRVSSKNIKNKDTLTNLHSNLWSSSLLKESPGEVSRAVIIEKQEKNNKYCLPNIDDKLSESTDDDGEDDTNDEDDEKSNYDHTRAPLELMAEFLRAVMDQDYHLAKKLCQMILIYEPENPEAKEFSSLIEEMLLMEKAPSLEEDDEDSEEESSSESEGESSEDLSEESSEGCEDE
ncbi:glutamate-rich protein 2 isoform X2 [Dasypus novemcinctus]|uniref:glutamate-rich protein 2 isoform X2 n=1 Tax=Dasypus novemcinctus TaxID=9361 RepID=UPI00265D99FE|nr:glutamate-rich protein 2 isoform X2 [Dasypus novemcinctus]